jgi:hypothetical protein
VNDFFLCKLAPDFSVVQSFVIDNAELMKDIYPGLDYTLVSMELSPTAVNKDSFPILLQGEVEVPRDGNRGNGVLIVLNEEFEFERFFYPSTGNLGQVAVDGHMAYLELIIPDNEPYIIVGGTDTIFNQVHAFDSTNYGRQTVVLCKYYLLSDHVVWTIRIGNVGFEVLKEIQVDAHHDLIVLGATSSRYFSFNDVDTVINNSDHNPFIGKYCDEGEFMLGILNPNVVSEEAN